MYFSGASLPLLTRSAARVGRLPRLHLVLKPLCIGRREVVEFVTLLEWELAEAEIK